MIKAIYITKSDMPPIVVEDVEKESRINDCKMKTKESKRPKIEERIRRLKLPSKKQD